MVAHAYLEGIYSAAYAGINRANSVIDRVPAVQMDEVRRNWPFLRDRRIDAYGGIEKLFID